MRRGRFIVVEGLDGAGSSTQVWAIQKFLLSQQLRCDVTKEPSNGPFGAVIRQAIEGRVSVSPRALALAFAADRADHLDNVTIRDDGGTPESAEAVWTAKNTGINEKLSQGVWVICDRYVLSNLAYQGSQGVDLDWLVEINRGITTPDVTVLVRTPVDVCLRRIQYRSSHLELFDDPGRLTSVWERFVRVIHLGKTELLGHLIEVEGTAAVEAVTKEIIRQLCSYFVDELPKLD
jgi:dTMP kinase